jgi:hypothetical protein
MSHLTQMQSTFDKELLLTRIRTKDDYKFSTIHEYNHFNINDKIVCFFNGIDWNVILLEDMLAYPVLYFDFYSNKDDTTYTNSLVVCPITMRSLIYKGKIQIIDVVGDNLYLLNTDTNDEFFMTSPFTGQYDDKGIEKKIKSHIKRFEVKILTLRDCFMFVLDPKFIIVNDKTRTIIYNGYYTNRFLYNGIPIYTTFHPKTIVYMVQYYSHIIKDYRYTVIVGKDINKDTITGYNYKTSGLWIFINQHIKSFIEKKAYIYPIFWFMVEKLYHDVKIITIV